MADTTSILTGGSNSFQTTAEHLNNPVTDYFSDGVVGVITNTSGVAPMTGALAANAQGSPNMTVAVTAGVAYVTATPTGQASQRLRAKIAAQNATIAANATGATRYDWIYVTINATNANTPNVAGDNVASITVSRSTSNTTDNGTPPTYGKNIAIVTVANGASSITNGNIADTRIRSVSVGGVNDTNGNEVLKVSATASAVNEVTFTNAATGSAPIVSATGDDTNINLALKAKGNGLVKLSLLRQDDTTNTYQLGNSVMLTGWGVISATAANLNSKTVTFGVTFLAKPIVIITGGGDNATLSTYGSGGNNVKAGSLAKAHTITTTNFVAAVWSDSAYAGTEKIFYQWMAIGEI